MSVFSILFCCGVVRAALVVLRVTLRVVLRVVLRVALRVAGISCIAVVGCIACALLGGGSAPCGLGRGGGVFHILACGGLLCRRVGRTNAHDLRTGRVSAEAGLEVSGHRDQGFIEFLLNAHTAAQATIGVGVRTGDSKQARYPE